MNRKLLLFIIFIFGLQLSYSQNNWDGDNPFGNLSYCNNWFADICPATWNSTTDFNIQLKNNNAQITMYLDFGTWKDVNNITYFATYNPAVLLNQFDADGPFGNENGINFYGKMENYSPNNTQVFNLPFHGKNGSVIEINPINSGFTFNRPIYNSGNKNFNVYGPNAKKVTLNDYPEGNNTVGFYIKQYSIVEVNYNNVASLSGGYFVEEGELWVNSNGVIQGGIQVGNGNTNTNKLYISNIVTPTTVANAITVPANSTNATIGSLNTSNTHTYSGTINLNNNAVNIDVVSAGGSVDFTNVISGTGGIKKISPGLARLSASNTYTGNTVVTQGTLQFGITNAISNSSNTILNGGTLSTGATTGYSCTVGTLALTDNSTIALGTGTHTLTFGASNAVAWTGGKVLTITGWTNSCTGAKVFVGNSNTGLTATQLAQVQFSGYPLGAKITSIGELIPNNVILTATTGTSLGAYDTMKATFDAINLGTHTGVISISVLNDTNEGTATAALNQVAGVTSVAIQPAGCGPRTISGATTAGNPLIDLNGADNVTINGLNVNGNSLTITNTAVSNTVGTCTIRLQADATFNTITNCTILGSATMAVGTFGGTICFGANSTAAGSDNNTISSCNIGPAGVNLPSKAIYFSGTGGKDNDNITITNNNIYDYFNAAVASSGIDIGNFSTAVTISNNKLYQTATRTQTFGVTHSGIRVGNTSGAYTITGNTIGYSSSTGTGTYNFVGVASSVFNPIMLSVSTASATSVQNNTIAGITHSTSSAVFATLFNAIVVTAGSANIGSTSANTIGLATAPIIFTATAGFGGTVNGINVTSASPGTSNIQNNTIQSITTNGIAAAAFDFNGITAAGSGIFTITNNTIGHSVAANSINLGTLGVSTAFSTFKGINSSATGTPLTIGSSGFPNIIQNITMNANASNAFNGITTTGANATTNIDYNSIRGIKFASSGATTSVFNGISNSGAVTSAISISNNSLGIAGTDLVTYTAACSGLMRGINNSGGTATAALSILSNDFRGITHTAAGTSNHNYITNSAVTLSQDISSNTFTNLNVNTTGIVTFLSDGVTLSATGTKNLNSNSIVGTFVKGGATGSLIVYLDNSSSVAGSVINNNNNNFSNITVSGSTAVTGWQNTDGGASFPTKNANNNTFSNWSLGSSAVTVLSVNYFATTSSVSNNTISNISCSNNITGLFIGNQGTATTLNVNSNNITSLTSNGAGGIVIGLSNSQPATTLTNNTNSNTITGLSSTSGAVTAIDNSSASLTKAISNNTINTLTSANNGLFRAINVNPLGATNNTISGNTISGMTNTNTGTSAFARAIEVQGTGPVTISGNTISNINLDTTNPGAAASTAIVGILCGSTNVSSSITANTISGLNATTTAAVNVSVGAIVTSSSAAGGTIAKNRIYSLTNASTGANNFVVGFIPVGGGWTFTNNMISIINSNTVQALGVYDTGGNLARKYYYNSIYIGGTHAGTQVSAAFQYNSATGSADIKNNIFVMNRTSGAKNYAIANLGGSFTGFTCNYNVLNCSDATTIGTNGTDQNFTTWKTVSSGDANSFSGIPVSFANTATADLHITSSCSDIESGGIVVSVTDDYDSTARSVTTPDIGADEYSGSMPANITLTATPSTTICSGSSTSITASSTDLTYVYTWSPSTGLSATTGATVTANPITTTTYTVTGTSPATCVKLKTITITVNPVPTAITVSPSSVNMCANTIQTFVASPVSSSQFTIGTRSGVSLAATTPYRTSIAVASQNRVQYLITKAELNAMGIVTAGKITSLGFNVETVGTGTLPTFDITMANTTDTALTATFITGTFTSVYSYSGAGMTPVLGLNTHTFSTSFAWDGTSNIVINICHTSSGSGTLYGVSVASFGVNMSNSRSGAGACSIAASIAGTSTVRPVMTLGFENPITWSPTTNLYTDVACTTAYNSVTSPSLATVYSKPTAPIVYTASSTNPATGCASTNTGTITMSASTWNGASWSPATPTGNTSLNFTGNYTSSGSLSGCSCSVTAGNVIFNDPDALILTNGLTVTAPGTLKFNNNASLVQTNDAATNSGIITMERITQPMYRFDYTYWGSPVTFASNFALGGVNGLSPDTLSDKYYSWTPTIANAGGNWAQESAASIMNPIKGYIVRAPATFSFNPASKTPYTANFIGTPNNGVISSPIYHGTLALGVNDDKYNLLGNPYPSALDAQAFLTNPLNTPIIDGTIYFWTHNSPISALNGNPFYGTFALNYNNNDYAAWNSLGAIGFRGIQAGTGGVIPNGYIAAGQGFFTKSTGTAATGATVTFNNAMRVTGNNDRFFRSTNTSSDKNRVWVDLISNAGDFSQILVGYLADATLGWDRMYDGVPIDESGMLLYSIIPDRKLVIQGRPLPFEEQDQVPLGFKSIHQDTYSFGLDAVDGLFENQNVYIEDKTLNIIHDLKQSPYVFTSEIGTFNDRFVLRYTDAALHNPDFNNNQSLTAFISNHQLHAESSQTIQNIEVYDISGKWITTYTPKVKSKEFITEFSYANGVYLAKVKLENGLIITKKLIQ